MTTADAILDFTTQVVPIMLLMTLVVLAVSLTVAMFVSRHPLLGFPSAMFWMILGGGFYGLSAHTWDLPYIAFFASSFGMTVFCMLSAYALKKKTVDEPWADEGKYVDEEKKSRTPRDKETDGFDDSPKLSQRTRELRERAALRRSRYASETWGEIR